MADAEASSAAGPAPLRARHIYGGIGAVFAARAGLILPAALLVFVPLGVLDALDHTLESLDIEELGDFGLAALLGGATLHVASVLLGEVFFAGVVTAIVAERRTGERHPLLEVARRLPYGTLIAIDLLTVLAVAIGAVALILPAIVLTVWLSLAAPVAELERRGAIVSMRRSRELVRGRFWTAFWVVIPLLVLNDLLSTVLESLKTSVLGETFLADWLGATTADVLLSPPYAIAVALLAFELRDRSTSAPG